MTSPFVEAERVRATAWKARTATLPDGARPPAPYIRDGKRTGWYPFCLPPEFACYNLLPEVRADTRAYFAREAIVWHQRIDGGPTNNLLSSQVQCVNALGAMNDDPARLVAAFGEILDVEEVLEIEPGRRVAFEYIGERDYLGEVPAGARHRGSKTTSADAAIRYRTSAGDIEIALIEWKYTEDYRGSALSAGRTDVRQARYRATWQDPAGPLRSDVIPYEDVFVEPFYQLMRQQLLARQMEEAEESDATRVRVVHVSPPGNTGLRTSLNRYSHHAAGSDVFDIWTTLLRTPDRFIGIDSSIFLDPAVTGVDYIDRYG